METLEICEQSQAHAKTGMGTAPFFSICVPTYNYAHYLPELIESVLDQSYGNYELLIQDDVSTDNTDEVVGRYHDRRISYHKNQENLGIFGNLNRLCERARGKYIKILCADDVLSGWCLESIYKVIVTKNFDSKLISVRETPDRDEIAVNPSLRQVNIFSVDRTSLFSYLTRENCWGAGLAEICVEKSFFKSIGYFGVFDKNKDFSKDILTWFDMVLRTPATLIDHPLVFQRPHRGQARYKLSRITQLREMFAYFYERESEFSALPSFNVGREKYLERYVLSHYWYGIKALISGRGGSYLAEVGAVLRHYGYSGFPWRLAFTKLGRRMLFISDAGYRRA